MLAPLPRPKVLTVMPTYQCTAACSHCGTYSSPHDETWLPEDLMLKGIDQAVDAGYQVVVFTGGEPTLATEILLRGIEAASARGVTTRLVTNAWWAVDDAEADKVIADLVAAGLNEINFSTGDQHARFVPVDNVVRATRAACRGGLKTIVIMIELVEERTITKATLTGRDDFSELAERYPDVLLRVSESPWMPVNPLKFNAYPDDMAVDRESLPFQSGCDSCLKTTALQADGRIAACCGLGMRRIPELQLGNIRDTTIAEADATASGDLLKRWIRVEGPEQILAWAATHDAAITWEGMYAHRCQACMRLYRDERVRRVIADHYVEKVPDIVFGEWLMYEYSTGSS